MANYYSVVLNCSLLFIQILLALNYHFILALRSAAAAEIN